MRFIICIIYCMILQQYLSSLNSDSSPHTLLIIFLFTLSPQICHQPNSILALYEKNHLKVSSKMHVIYVSEYVQCLHIKQTIAAEYVLGILRFTKQQVYVSSFTNMFYKSQVWEKIHGFLQFSWRELQARNQWPPLKSTFSEGLGSASWDDVFSPFSCCTTCSWARMAVVVGFGEVS